MFEGTVFIFVKRYYDRLVLFIGGNDMIYCCVYKV